MTLAWFAFGLLLATSDPAAEKAFREGIDRYNHRDYAGAAESLERAVRLNPQEPEYHRWLGRVYSERADREHSLLQARKAKHEFETAVTLDPSNTPARRDLSEYEMDAPWFAGGDKDDARAQVEAIERLDPLQGRLARAIYDLRALKRPDLAENEYRAVLAAHPRSADPYFEILEFYQRQNRPDAMASVLAGTPADPRLAYWRGVERVMASQNFDQAERDLREYIANSPERSDWPSHNAAREWLGQLYQKEGRLDDAAAVYREALRIQPTRKSARERLDRLEKSK